MSDYRQVTERFLRYVQKGDDCWEWTGGKNAQGYGLFSLDGRCERAPRVSYRLFVGPIPEGLHVCHSCDNPSCVRPDHLWVGTNRDNARDRDFKGRNAISRHPAEEIRSIRILLARGLVQREICRIIGCAETYVSNVKHGYVGTCVL